MTDGAHDHPEIIAQIDSVAHGTVESLANVYTRIDALTARVKALETGISDPAGFRRAFFDDFTDRTILRGHMGDVIKGTYVGAVYADRYLWNTWTTSHGGGIFDLGQAEIANGKLDILVETKTAVPFGKTVAFTGPWIAGFKPVADVANLATSGGIAGPFIFEFRIRADLMPGYKGVPLLWSTRDWHTLGNATGPDDVKWPDGEIDWPESSFDKQPGAYVHHSGALKTDPASSYQQAFTTPAGTTWQDWHTYRMVFYPSGIAGATWTPSVELFLDGNSIGKVTDRVPGNVPFRPNMQFEPNLVSTAPSTTVRGHIQIDHIVIWVPA